jgi:hypothetical protein
MPTTESAFANITTTVPVSKDAVQGLLVGVFEYGYSSWLRKIIRHNFAPGLTYQDFQEDGKMQGEDYFHPSQIIPVTDGCSSIWLVDDPDSDTEGAKQVVVDPDTLRKALQVMAEKYPRHFHDLMEENDDAGTADAFGQCVAYGEIIFC